MKYNFCVVTQPRSGDELLISKLRSHPNIYITLGNPYSEFINQTNFDTFKDFLLKYKFQKQNYDLKYNEQDIVHSLNTREYMETYYNDQITTGCIDESERNFINNYLNLIYSKDKTEKKEGNKIATECVLKRYREYGFTMYIEHILANQHEELLTRDVKYVLLFRKNLLWQYVSTLLPVTVNEHGYTKIIDTQVSLEPEKLKEFIHNTLCERQEVESIIVSKQVPYIEIYYEDIVKFNRKTLDTVQYFLNVPVQKEDLYGINPDNIYEETRPIDTIINNYCDLKEYFKSDENILQYFKMAEDSVNPFYYEIRKSGTFKSLDFLREMCIGKP